MRSLMYTTLAAFALFSLPALAEDKADAVKLDVEKTVEKIKPEDITRQETIALGGNRFLIFSGTAGEKKQYGYTVDLVKIEGGVPRFEPLFMEEFIAEANAAKLEYGVAFFAQSYHFNKNDNTLDYTTISQEDETRIQHKYKLDVDIFKLQEVITQAKPDCAETPCKPALPKVAFSLKDAKPAAPTEQADAKPEAKPEVAAEAKPDLKPAAKAPESKAEIKPLTSKEEKKESRPFSIIPITGNDLEDKSDDAKKN